MLSSNVYWLIINYDRTSLPYCNNLNSVMAYLNVGWV